MPPKIAPESMMDDNGLLNIQELVKILLRNRKQLAGINKFLIAGQKKTSQNMYQSCRPSYQAMRDLYLERVEFIWSLILSLDVVGCLPFLWHIQINNLI